MFELRFLFCSLFTCSVLAQSTFDRFVYHNSYETMQKIQSIITKKEKGMYLRLGDGEIAIALGYGRSGHQLPNPVLKLELLELCSLRHENIIKAADINYVLRLPDMNRNHWDFPNWYSSEAKRTLSCIKKLWNESETDIYSVSILVYAYFFEKKLLYSFLNFLKLQNCVLFVGNKNIPEKIKTELFGNNCDFVGIPHRNAYDQINAIEDKCLDVLSKNNDEYKIVITAAGVCGKALQKRLWSKFDNIFFFDFGSLMDAICSFKAREWIRKCKFDSAKFFNDWHEYNIQQN